MGEHNPRKIVRSDAHFAYGLANNVHRRLGTHIEDGWPLVEGEENARHSPDTAEPGVDQPKLVGRGVHPKESRIGFQAVTSDALRETAWNAAGRAAAELVEPGMFVGLGTGRAAAAAIHALGHRVGDGLRVRGVPTSRASDALARACGIPVARLSGPIDIAFDGADAVTPDGLVIKGAGGALVRERLVANAAARFVVLVDGPKLVRSLDEWGRLPLAVLPFAIKLLERELADLSPVRRPGRSDDELAIVDVRVPPGTDWRDAANRVAASPGVVEHGLFEVPLADVLVGAPDGSSSSADTAKWPDD